MKSNYDVALEVLSGKWGNGIDRRNRLTDAGYNYNDVQSIVNALVKDGYTQPQQNKIEAQKKEEKSKSPVIVDFDIQKNDGIQINIII